MAIITQRMRVDILVEMNLLRKYFDRQAIQPKVIPVTTEEYGMSKARRPFNSRLETKNCKILGLIGCQVGNLQ